MTYLLNTNTPQGGGGVTMMNATLMPYIIIIIIITVLINRCRARRQVEDAACGIIDPPPFARVSIDCSFGTTNGP